MLYFLDFDRTVFDTPAFKKALAKRPSFWELMIQGKEVLTHLLSPERNISRRRIYAKTFGTYVSHGRFDFSPSELQEFLYPDVPPFLTEHPKECIIVTYGVRAFIT